MKKLLLILSICFFILGITACSTDSNKNKQDYVGPETISLQVGDRYKIENVGKDVEVVVEDISVATVSVTNVVTAVKEGQTKIKLIFDDKVFDEISLVVTSNSFVEQEQEVVESIYRITLSASEKRIYINSNFVLTANVYKNNSVCNESVEWIFGENNSIVSTSINGNKISVLGVGYGITNIVAKIGEFTATCKVIVADMNSQVLSAPILSGLTEDTISWLSVNNAESYKVSINNGLSWVDVDGTSFDYADANPLKIRVVAVGNGINYENSSATRITQENVSFSCGDRLVFYKDKTVSGAVNTEKTSATQVDIFANISGQNVKIEGQEFSLSNTNVISMNGNEFAPINEGEAEISLVDIKDITLKAIVGTPIKNRVDMDALGFAYKNNTHSELWAYGRVFLLANDIDYAVDVSNADKGYRMTDSNSTADIWDRYIIPIAFSQNGGSALGASMSNGLLEWGIFGQICKDGAFFRAIFDGDNHVIKNAVIPYGSMFCYGQGVNAVINNNFMGALAYGAKLCNVAFVNLEFEDPIQIADSSNPYYTDANTNLNGTLLKDNGYIRYIKSDKSIFGLNYGSWQGLNLSNQAGLVGCISNAVVENVYVDAIMKNATWTKSTGYASGLIVGVIYEDYYENGRIYMNTYGTVKNCVAVTSYWNSSNVGYNDAIYNAGMGAIVGRSFTNRDKTVTNCFAISNPKSNSYALSTSSVLVPFGNVDANASSVNCGVYDSVSNFKTAQVSVIPQITILKQIQEFKN